MKQCLYCREDIREDAIKCRYCGSALISLDPSQVQTKNDDSTVTYVVDRGLLRFAKFVGAALALFIVAGAYLFGFKLDDAVEKLRDSQGEIAQAQASLATAKAELDEATQVVAQLEIDVQNVLKSANEFLGDIQENQALADQILSAMRVAGPNSTIDVTTIVSRSTPGTNTPRPENKPIPHLWSNGTTIQISFLDGTRAQKEKVQTVANEWLEYANLRFEFRAEESAVRISFAQPGNWTELGTNALAVDEKEPTMNLVSIKSTPGISGAERRIILHEFGHLLGLVHEHQSPNAKLNWDRHVVYSSFAQPPNYMDHATINNTLLEPVSSTEYDQYRDFDPTSVMNFELPARFFTDRMSVRPGQDLSESDKQFVAILYP